MVKFISKKLALREQIEKPDKIIMLDDNEQILSCDSIDDLFNYLEENFVFDAEKGGAIYKHKQTIVDEDSVGYLFSDLETLNILFNHFDFPYVSLINFNYDEFCMYITHGYSDHGDVHTFQFCSKDKFLLVVNALKKNDYSKYRTATKLSLLLSVFLNGRLPYKYPRMEILARGSNLEFSELNQIIEI